MTTQSRLHAKCSHPRILATEMATYQFTLVVDNSVSSKSTKQMPNTSLRYSSKITNVTQTGMVHAILDLPSIGITRATKSTYPCQATSTKPSSDLTILPLTNHNTNHIPTQFLPTAQPSSMPNTSTNHLQQPKPTKNTSGKWSAYSYTAQEQLTPHFLLLLAL